MRHRYRKLIVLLGYLVVVGMIVQGCGPALTGAGTGPASQVDSVDATKPVDLTFWHTQTGDNAKTLQAIINDFHKDNPTITIKAEYVGSYTDLYKKAMAAISGGGLPDLAVAYESMVADYMDANAVVPVDDYVKSTKFGLTKAETDDFVPAFWEANKYPQFKNQMLSFPFTKSMLAMYYNADLLKAAGITKAPETWDDFQVACDALQKNNVKCLAIAVDASTIDGWIYSRGGTLLSDDLKSVKFNAAPAYDSLTMIQSLVKKGEAYQISKQYADQADFGAQRAAFAFATTAGLTFWNKEVGGKFNWGIAVLPHAKDVKPVTVQYGGNIAIFKSTPEKQLAAWKFVKYFTSKDVTARWAAASNYTPVRLSAFDTAPIQQKVKDLPQYGTAINDVLPYASPEPYVKGWQATRSFLEDGLVAVINGTKDPKTAIDEAADKANKALSQ